jgi:hypothetical protein
MDPLRALNLRQGYFTRQDAIAHGHDDRSISRALKNRSWRRLRVGTYTWADLWPESPEDVHRCGARALFHKLRPAVALSHVSAAVEHDLRIWGADLSLLHVTRLDAGAGRREGDVLHHEGFLLDSDLVDHGGVVVTHPARAAIETASLLTAEQGLVTLDSALHLALCTSEELLETYRIMQSWPGMQRGGVTVRMADGGGQSIGESRTRYLCYAQGLPAPETQYDVRDRLGTLIASCDLAWPAYRLIVEFDGRIKYGRLLREGEQPGDAVWREKLREDAIREALPGWHLVRLVWADLDQPVRTAARLRRVLQLAA